MSNVKYQITGTNSINLVIMTWRSWQLCPNQSFVGFCSHTAMKDDHIKIFLKRYYNFGERKKENVEERKNQPLKFVKTISKELLPCLIK